MVTDFEEVWRSVEALRQAVLAGYIKPSRDEQATLALAIEIDWLRGDVEVLKLAEEGAKEAFGHVVQQKHDTEAECKKLRTLLDSAHETIRRECRKF